MVSTSNKTEKLKTNIADIKSCSSLPKLCTTPWITLPDKLGNIYTGKLGHIYT